MEETAPAPDEAILLPSYWLDGALPSEDDIEDGTWIWEPDYFPEGIIRVHSHPSGKGVHFHGFRNSPIHMVGHPMITQEVWLDPADPPRGIMVKFVLTSGDEIGVYWEGEEEVFFPLIEKEGPMEIWYYGMLPELGKWTPLTILAEDLALEDQDVVGLKFVTYDGRALWGRTSVSEAPAPEENNTPVS